MRKGLIDYKKYNTYNKLKKYIDKSPFLWDSGNPILKQFYSRLNSIKQRCSNPNSTGYNRYGGRGIGFLITVHDIIKLWYRDRAWKLNSPSLDRKNNDGHYTFDNCRFIESVDNSKKAATDRKNKKEVINYLHKN